MGYVLLSVLCSVVVAVLLKLAKRYGIDAKQAIAWNYVAAAILSWLFFDIRYSFPAGTPYPAYVALSVLLPSVFIAIAVSIRQSGIVRTAIAQRLSLIIPVIAAFVLFGEELSFQKTAGLIVGFAAIICSVPWQTKDQDQKKHPAWIYPFVVFAGTGVIDVFFNQIAQYRGVPFTTSLFIVFLFASLISMAVLTGLFITKKDRFSIKNMLAGLILGLVNFGSIVFYLLALRNSPDRPSVIFSALDIGVIALGALAGLFLFNEKLSLLNKTGILLAVITIIIVTFS